MQNIECRNQQQIPAGACVAEFANQTVWLLPQAAVYWPERKTLFIADVHLGKAASFRQQGQPVPMGTTTRTLDRLEQALQSVQTEHLVVLGDFLHSAAARRSSSTMTALADWRGSHPALHITLIRGNHDLHAGDPAQALTIDVVPEPWALGPFECRHEPVDNPCERFWLAGHVHPVFNLKGRGGDRVRLQAFAVSDSGCILPAFGAFTGGHAHQFRPAERCYVIVEDSVLAVPESGLRATRG